MTLSYINWSVLNPLNNRGRSGRDRMVFGATTNYAIGSVAITTEVVNSNPAQARCNRYIM